MIGVFNTITVNGKEIFRGNDFTLQKEWIYAGEVVTCTGKYCADIVGWRYSDLTISWDNLPQDQLRHLLALNGQSVSMTFRDTGNRTATESVIPTVLSGTATRLTGLDGKVAWKGISLQIKFIDAHSLREA